MMKTFLTVLIGLLLLISCKNKNGPSLDETLKKAGYTQRTVKLKNGLGTVIIYLPNELDTFYVHRHFNDIPDGGPTYRFSSKKYYIFHDTADNWFMNNEMPDSLYQFEIIQYDDPYLVGDSTHFTEELLERTYKSLLPGDLISGVPFKDTVINDRRYLFRYYRNHARKGNYNYIMYVQTFINGYKLEFNFTYSGKYINAFYNHAVTSLSTLQVSGMPAKKYTAKDVRYVIYNVYCTGPGGAQINYELTRDSLFVDSANSYNYGKRRKKTKFHGLPLSKTDFVKKRAIMDSLPNIFLNCNTNEASFGRGPAYFNHCWVLIEIDEGDRVRYFTVDTGWEGVPEEVKKYAMLVMRLQ